MNFNLGVRAKILAVVAMPLIILAGINGFIIIKEVRVMKEIERLQILSNFSPKISSLVHEMQKERGASALNISRQGGFAQELNEQHKETNAQLTQQGLQKTLILQLKSYNKM